MIEKIEAENQSAGDETITIPRAEYENLLLYRHFFEAGQRMEIAKYEMTTLQQKIMENAAKE